MDIRKRTKSEKPLLRCFEC